MYSNDGNEFKKEKSIFDIFPELKFYLGQRSGYQTSYAHSDRAFWQKASRFLNGMEEENSFYEFLVKKLGTINVNMDDGLFIRECIKRPDKEKFMKYLLANGADTKVLGITHLHLACYFGDVKKVKEILTDFKTDIEAKTIDGLTPAEVTPNSDILKLLGKENSHKANFNQLETHSWQSTGGSAYFKSVKPQIVTKVNTPEPEETSSCTII